MRSGSRGGGRGATIVCGALAVALVIVALPSSAQADAKSDARSLVQEGARLYDKGDFAGALGQFDQAYAKYPNAIIQFNRAQALRSLGRPVEAAEAVERFLKEAIDAPVDRLREAQQLLAELQSQIGSLAVTSNVDGAEVSVDGAPVGTTPLARPVTVKPGAHRIAVRKAGMVEFTRSVDVAPGARAAVDARLAATPAAPPPPETAATPPASVAATGGPPAPDAEGGSVMKTVGLSVAAVGVASLAVGVVYGLKTMSTNDEAEKICAGKTVCVPGTPLSEITRHGELVSDAKSFRTISIIGFVAGAAAVAGGAVLWFTAPSRAERASARLTPIGGVGMAGVGLEGVF